MSNEIYSSTISQTQGVDAAKPTTPVLPFVGQFSVSGQNFVDTLKPKIGQKTARGKFAPPTTATKANIKLFLQTLYAYEASPSAELMTKLNDLMQALDISAVRLQELPNDAVIFYPNPTKDNNTPLVCGGVLTWRFGAVQVTGDPSTYNNPVPGFFVFDPHSGQDGTIQSVTTQFMAGAKGLLSHAFNPNVADNPNFKGDPITPTNIRRFADPAHSNTTAFVPFVETLVTLYPKAAGTITHGMSGKPNFQMIANNDYLAKFLQNGQVSFAALMTIALGIESLANDPNPSFPTNPNIVVIQGTVPGYVISNGQKAALISTNDSNSPLRLNAQIGDNSDCVGHMLNGANPSPFSMGKHTDRAWFMEFGPLFRAPNSHVMKIFAAAQANANKWYTQYDPTIHDPWQLAKRFPDVYNNMALYPQLFVPNFIAAYKVHGTNPFCKSSSAAALADQEAEMQALAQTTTAPEDAETSQVMFSAAAASLGRSKQTGFFAKIAAKETATEANFMRYKITT